MHDLTDSQAPAFSLMDQRMHRVSSADFRGRNALVVFIPFPFTGVCEGELCAIRDGLPRLDEVDANVVAITCDTPFSNRAWAEQQGYDFPLLSDYWPHGEVARAYDCFDEARGCATRSTFVLDAAGVVRRIISSEDFATAREFDLYVEALQAV